MIKKSPQSPIFMASISALLLSCHSIQNFGSNESIKSSATAPAASEGSQNPNQDPKSDKPKPPIADEGALPEEALPPAIVSGGFLVCQPADFESIQCFIPDESGNPQALPNDVDVSVLFVPEDGESIFLDFQREETVGGGTLLLISTKDLPTGNIVTSVTRGETDADWVFDLGSLASDGEGDIGVIPADDFELLNFGFNPDNHFGDDIIANENDNCFGPTPITGALATANMQFIVQGELKDVFIYMTDICGLQSGETTITISGPVPFKSQTIRLKPNTVSNLLLRSDLPPGSYQLSLDNSRSPMAGGTQDDFTFGALRFLSPVQQSGSILTPGVP